MHLAFPPRKSSHPPPYLGSRWSPANATAAIRRQRAIGVVIFVASLIIFFLFLRTTSSSEPSERIPTGTPEVVIVTLLDDSLSKSYIEKIRNNRDDYAARHGKFVAGDSITFSY